MVETKHGRPVASPETPVGDLVEVVPWRDGLDGKSQSLDFDPAGESEPVTDAFDPDGRELAARIEDRYTRPTECWPLSASLESVDREIEAEGDPAAEGDGRLLVAVMQLDLGHDDDFVAPEFGHMTAAVDEAVRRSRQDRDIAWCVRSSGTVLKIVFGGRVFNAG